MNRPGQPKIFLNIFYYIRHRYLKIADVEDSEKWETEI